jgi:chemotaxis protein methyltransferase CheR
MSTLATIRDLTREEYELFRQLVYKQTGINLGDQKMQLVRARLGKRLRAGNFRSYRAYYEHVKGDKSGRELHYLVDAISTNTTHLFREKQHFDFLAQTLRDWLADRAWRERQREVRIWSAACSSGEEPHSIAMTAHDALHNAGGVGLKILATDICTAVLEKAKEGIYDAHRVGTVPSPFRHRYFTTIQHKPQPLVQVVPELRRLITFAYLNLMAEKFPFRYPFDLVFCRNVMIYFDRPTQQAVVAKLARHIRPGGYLLIGHSESLNAIKHSLKYVRPTIYQKPAS